VYSYLRGHYRGRAPDADATVVLEVAGVGYAVVVPPIVEQEIAATYQPEDELVLYVSAQSTRDLPWPTLFGFLRPQEKTFWELLCTIPRVGGKSAAKAMAAPVAAMAQAIHDGNKVFLDGLPGVTLDGAEKMVASLRKKVGPFLEPLERATPRPAARTGEDEIRDDAVSLLVVMGVKRPDAQRAVDQILGSHDDIVSVQDVITEYFRAARSAR
jgi:holliday junction DNA helicase RuvA